MDLVRYDGTRFITEEEIDREFTGHWVLIATNSRVNAREGFLIASAKDIDERNMRSELADIGLDEYNGHAKIIYGCKTRGMNLHVELLD